MAENTKLELSISKSDYDFLSSQAIYQKISIDELASKLIKETVIERYPEFFAQKAQ